MIMLYLLTLNMLKLFAENLNFDRKVLALWLTVKILSRPEADTTKVQCFAALSELEISLKISAKNRLESLRFFIDIRRSYRITVLRNQLLNLPEHASLCRPTSNQLREDFAL